MVVFVLRGGSSDSLEELYPNLPRSRWSSVAEVVGMMKAGDFVYIVELKKLILCILQLHEFGESVVYLVL